VVSVPENGKGKKLTKMLKVYTM